MQLCSCSATATAVALRVLSATSGNTPRETTPTGVAIPGPSLIVTTMEGDLAASQPNPAARSAGATTSGSEAVNEDSEDMPNLTDGRLSIRAEAVVDTKDLRELTGNRHRQPPFSWRYGHQNEPNFGPRGGLAAEPHPPQILLGFASSTLANQRLPLCHERASTPTCMTLF